MHVFSNWKKEPGMKRLISEEELRSYMEEAYIAGWNDGEWGMDANFAEYYDYVFGGPDCE